MGPPVSEEASSPFANRLRKNAKHLRKWAKREGLTAYRLYDRDMPDYPYAVDWYDGRVQVAEFPRSRALRSGEAERLRETVVADVQSVLEVPAERVFVKTHVPKKWGQEQYESQGRSTPPFTVEENGLRFQVELGAHLDTGLFLDHRNTRARVRTEAEGRRFLNLFAYTGSFTVYAAAGGAASTTTVDLSKTYLDWAAKNLELNGFREGQQHQLVRADAKEWLSEAASQQRGAFDLIVLDPPSFSTSKAMKGNFDVQRDHPRLVGDAIALLSPRGILYFSTNFTGFQLSPALEKTARFTEITPASLPQDIGHKSIHRCWRVERSGR